MAPRYIKVEVPGREPVEVRVVSRHPDDDALNRQLYRVENIWDWCDAQLRSLTGYWRQDASGESVWMPPTVTAKQIDEVADTVAGVKVKRDEAVRDLFKLVLANKLNGEQIEELLGTCDTGTVVRIFEAAKGIDPEALLMAMQKAAEKQAEKTSPQPSQQPSSAEPTPDTTPSES